MRTVETFSVWTPFDILKSANGGDAEPMTARIGGILSVESRDQQGETIIQDGIDWSYFLEKGWFNYEHAAGPDNVLGHPERVTSVDVGGKPATRVEGVLYLAKPKAREIYETATAMAKAGTSRRLGFSVEGQVVRRNIGDDKRIEKAKVLNVALTAHPVHPDARLEVLAKALAASGIGYQTPTAPSGAPGASLSALVPQSIEASPSLATFAGTRSYDAVEKFRGSTMSLSELAALLRKTFPRLSKAESERRAKEIAQSIH